MSVKQIYLAHAISNTADFNDSKRVANNLRKEGYLVKVASENKAINDKSNDPTPFEIYDNDIADIKASDIVVVNLNGGQQDGTISEVGFTSGYNEAFKDIKENVPGWLYKEILKYMELDRRRIIAYTSNARVLQPQFHKDVASAHLNHLVLAMAEYWGEFVGSEQDMMRLIRMEG